MVEIPPTDGAMEVLYAFHVVSSDFEDSFQDVCSLKFQKETK